MYKKFRNLMLIEKFVIVSFILGIVTKTLLYVVPFVPQYFLEETDLFFFPVFYFMVSNKLKYNPTLKLYLNGNKINPLVANRFKVITTSLIFLLLAMLSKVGLDLHVMSWILIYICIVVFTSSFYMTNISSYILALSGFLPFLINNETYSKVAIILLLSVITYLIASIFESKIRKK